MADHHHPHFPWPFMTTDPRFLTTFPVAKSSQDCVDSSTATRDNTPVKPPLPEGPADVLPARIR